MQVPLLLHGLDLLVLAGRGVALLQDLIEAARGSELLHGLGSTVPGRGGSGTQARARCPGSRSPQQSRVQAMSPGCASPPAATGGATAAKASRQSQAAGCLPGGLRDGFAARSPAMAAG